MNSTQTLVIRGGRVIDPANNIDTVTDILIENGKIKSVGSCTLDNVPTVDASGCIVSPGFIDTHVHLREPGQEEKETIATGSAAAISGGFSSICCMPNTAPALDNASLIEFIYHQSAKANLACVFPVGSATRHRQGEDLAEMALMSSAGAVGFSDDGAGIPTARLMDAVLKYCAMTGKVFMQHCEDPSMGGGAMNAGELATRLGLSGWPKIAEDLMIQRDVMLVRNQKYACRYHAQHMTTEGGAEILREAHALYRKEAESLGFNPEHPRISGEVSPHHLLLTEQACAEYDTHAKMNPPLRTQSDINALLNAVADGTITLLATDHAPHTPDDKARTFAEAPYGIIGLECAVSLYIKALIEPGVADWNKLISMLSWNGAKLVNLDKAKGHLGVGADADITLIDPEHNWTVDANQFAGRSRNCPFQSWSLKGRPITTIVGGEIKIALDPERLSQGAQSTATTPSELGTIAQQRCPVL